MKEQHQLTRKVPEYRELELAPEVVPPSTSVKSYGVDPSTTEEEFHIRDYWMAVRKRLWLVLGICALITMLAAIYMARKPDIYEAQVRVQVNLENSGSPLGNRGAPIFIGTGGNDPVYFNTQLQILTSQGLMRRVAKTLDLEHNQAFLRPQSTQNRSTWQSLVRMIGLGGSDKDETKNKANEELPLTPSVANATDREDLVEAKRLAPYVGMILGGLRVEPVKETRLPFKDTRLIDIRYSHQDPQITAKVVNAIADTYVYANLEKKNLSSATTGDLLQKRIAELQSQIRTDEERLINYARNNEMLSLDAKQNTVVERLVGLNRQLLEAENERKLAEATYRAALNPDAASALAEDNAKDIAEAEAKLGDLRQKLAQLLVENTEEWPEVKEVKQQIATLEKQIKDRRSRATSNIITNLETRYRQTKAREDALRADFNKQRSETITQNEAAIQYRIIQQEIDTNKSLLDGLLKSSSENNVIMSGTPNNIHVVDYALTPDGPVGPRRTQSVFLAFIVSLGLGIGLALFLEYMDDTVRSSDDVEKKLRLPALALIPASAKSIKRRLMPVGANALQLKNAGDNGHSELLIDTDTRSPLAEAYRQLRTSVLLSTAGRPPKTLLVTSSVPSEGKTTTAVNLAISLAQTGASVLVIDADMRRPRLHTLFDIDKTKGLSTILANEMSEAEILSLVEHHEQSGLNLLSSGSIPPNPAELIGSEQMRRLISMVESTFTHIVIDSPPIASFTDGVLLSSMVDGVLLVVHGGKSSRNIVRRSKQLLQDVGARILGVVLNNLDTRSHDYFYYQHYYHRSYYNSEVEGDEVTSSAQN